MRKQRIYNILIKSLLAIVALQGIVFSQTYPKWFLNPGQINCNQIAVGYAIEEFYQDSVCSTALKNSFENAAKNDKVVIKGGQLFWSTEGGTYWMGSNIKTEFDSSQIHLYADKYVYKDHFNSGHSTIALAALPNCKIDKTRLNLLLMKKPAWVNKAPKTKGYYYAIGQAPSYYYEKSSWLEAEKVARIRLAKQTAIEIKTLHKKDYFEAQEISSEELSVALKNIIIVARWVDVKTNIFYVLVKMPLQ